VSSEWEKVALEWLDRLNIGSDDSPQRWGEVVRLAALLAETHAAGKREGIEAAAQVADAYRREDNTILVSAAEYIATRIRALPQTEEKKP
jgi:hypothetical protein